MENVISDKSILNNIYGLSCVENYLLYAMTAEDYEYRPLYHGSYLSFCDVAVEFVENNALYASFYKIPRLHDIATENGLIAVRYLENADLLENININGYNIIMIKPEYIKSKYKTELWRDDHYMLISPKDSGNYHYLNDNPRDNGIISLEELKGIYAGKSINITIKNKISEELKNTFLNVFISSILSVSSAPQPFNFDLNDVVKARDILGVIRVLRKRIYEYCGMYISMDFYKDYLAELDRFYSLIEYMRIRNSADFDKINQIFEGAQKKDIGFTAEIKNKMEERQHGL